MKYGLGSLLSQALNRARLGQLEWWAKQERDREGERDTERERKTELEFRV